MPSYVPPGVDPNLLEQQRRLNRRKDLQKLAIAAAAAAVLVIVAGIVTLIGAIAGDDTTDDDRDTAAPPATSSTSTANAQPTGDDRIFPPGPNTLSFYEGMASYPWRVNIVNQQDELLAAMQAIAPNLDNSDFTDVVSTCDSLNNGTPRDSVDRAGIMRFGPSGLIDAEQARQLVDLSIQYACPDLG